PLEQRRRVDAELRREALAVGLRAAVTIDLEPIVAALVDGEADGRRPGHRPRVVGVEQKVESVPVLGFVAAAVVDRIDPADRQIGEGLTDGDRALVPGILSAAGPGVARIGQAGIITVAVAGRVAVAARIPVAGWVTVAGRIAVAGLIPIAG